MHGLSTNAKVGETGLVPLSPGSIRHGGRDYDYSESAQSVVRDDDVRVTLKIREKGVDGRGGNHRN